jgi:hypothetical protein
MQKPFIKCLIRQMVGWFLHSRKKLIRRFQKNDSIVKIDVEICSQKLSVFCIYMHTTFVLKAPNIIFSDM